MDEEDRYLSRQVLTTIRTALTGDECGDPDHPGLRVRRTNAARVFFYRYRARDGALREIKLGEFRSYDPGGSAEGAGKAQTRT